MVNERKLADLEVFELMNEQVMLKLEYLYFVTQMK